MMLIAGLLFPFCSAATLQKGTVVKKWRFDAQRGVVGAEMIAGLGINSDLVDINMDPEEPGTVSSTSEEARFLRSMIDSMHLLGLDQRNLSSINLQIVEQDVVEKMASAAAGSEEWHECMLKKCGGGELLVRILNSTGAYEVFNDIVHEFGLRVQVMSAEHISVQRISRLRSKNAVKIAGDPLVPVGATLGIALLHESTSNNQRFGKGITNRARIHADVGREWDSQERYSKLSHVILPQRNFSSYHMHSGE